MYDDKPNQISVKVFRGITSLYLPTEPAERVHGGRLLVAGVGGPVPTRDDGVNGNSGTAGRNVRRSDGADRWPRLG